MQWLKQSTAASVMLGPAVDDSDGYTPETGLTIAASDCRLSKNGAAFAAKNDATAASAAEFGWYNVEFDTTDTGTLGRLLLAASATGALPMWREFLVLPANTYDSLVAGTDNLDAEVATMAASAITASAFDAGAVDAAAVAASTISACTFGTGAIDAVAIGASSLTSTKFATGAIVADTLGASALSASKFAADAIDSATVAASTLASTKFATGTIVADVVAASALTSAKFASDAIIADVVGASVLSACSFGAGAIDAAAIGASAITSSELAATAADKVADHTIRRGFENACDSVDGDAKSFRSLLGAIAKLVNKVATSGGTLTAYEDDDTTSLGTQTVGTTPGADPITSLDTD